MKKTVDIDKVFFSEARLNFSPFFRFFWRVSVKLFYVFFAAATVFMLLSKSQPYFWTGILCALFLADRAFHYKDSDRIIGDIIRKNPEGVNIAEYCSPRLLRIFEKSLDKAEIMGSDSYLYLVSELLKEDGIRGSLWRLEVSPEEFEHKLEEEIKNSAKKNISNKDDFLADMELIAKMAFLFAVSHDKKAVEPDDVFASLGSVETESLKRLLYLFSIEATDLEHAAVFGQFRYKNPFRKILPSSLGGFAPKRTVIRHRFMNRAWTAKPTPNLDKYSEDITDLARAGSVGFMIGHEKEYDELVDVLSRPMRSNALLVGETGSGREVIINHLAFEIVHDRVPEPLFDKRVVVLRLGDLVSGVGESEIISRINAVMRDIYEAKNVILFIPDAHNLVSASGKVYVDIADAMGPILTGGEVQIIGATYPKEFKQHIESRSDFVEKFEVIRIEEISEQEAIRVLTYDALLLEEQYRVVISFSAIKHSVSIAKKYFRTKILPASAQDILKEALVETVQRGEKVVTAEHVVFIAERKTNVPIHKAGKEEAQKLLNLEKIIHQRFIDQEEGVKSVSRALREYRSGLSRSSGPISSFLFVGPTGVGKTELSKIIASVLFGSEEAMIRFDMSEYQDKQSIFRFIGSPDGKMSGNLTEAVIQKPYSLILLDEFEKAHPDLLNLFLQVFDDGRISDNYGRVVDFKNTLIIATSNANSEYIKEELEKGSSIKDISREIKKKLSASFRPELLNRFSDIVVFKNLSPEDIRAVARLQLNKLARLLDENQGIFVSFDEAVVDYIAEKGFDPVFGARPLRSAVSEHISGQLSEKILKQEIAKGMKLKAVMLDGEVSFTAG